MIKKLYKYSLLMMLGVPCMASDCDFNVGHREKHVSWMDTILLKNQFLGMLIH